MRVLSFLVVLVAGVLAVTSADARVKGVAWYEPAQVQKVFSYDVDEQGGVINLKNSKTPYDGLRIVIPQGTVGSKATVVVSFDNGVAKNVVDGKVLPGAIHLDFNGVNTLSKYVSFTLPESMVPVAASVCGGYIINPQTGDFEAMTSIDKNKVITIRPHASLMWICR